MDQSAQETAFSDDRVAYPSPLLPDQSQDRLWVSALLHGLATADPSIASVLEIGCGTGINDRTPNRAEIAAQMDRRFGRVLPPEMVSDAIAPFAQQAVFKAC